MKEAREVAPSLGMQIFAFNAGTIIEIDDAFTAMAREKVDALMTGGDGFFFGRRGQFAALAMRDGYREFFPAASPPWLAA
jgi:hypothetical protein